MRSRLGLLLLTWAVLAPAPVPGQSREPADRIPITKLTLHPAPAPKPALKYLLLPPLMDRKPGNAAVWYGKVTAEQSSFFGNRELWEKIPKWLEMPLAELRKDKKAPKYFNYFLDEGARRDHCDWEVPIREKEFFSILIPEAQQTRNFASLLALRARIQIAEGKFDEAVYTFQTGYSVGRHVSQNPFFISGLVGMANCQMMSKQLEQFIQQPGAPNLYWALNYLPRPLIDLHPAFEAEKDYLYLSYPELRDLEKKDYPPQQWQHILDQLIGRISQWSEMSYRPLPGLPQRLWTLGMVVQGYPRAKQFLIERGHTSGEVEAMPVAKVILIYTMQTYEEIRDDIFKWSNLPYLEARAGMTQGDRFLRTAMVKGREIIPIASTLLPAIERIREAGARNDRAIALLQTLEALRLYGASHEGRLPEKLSDITEVPVPLDPLTGKPFVYEWTRPTAVLVAPPPPGMPAENYGRRFEITFAPKGQKP